MPMLNFYCVATRGLCSGIKEKGLGYHVIERPTLFDQLIDRYSEQDHDTMMSW